jgi:hypothetical protein
VLGHGYKGLKWAEGDKERGRREIPSTGNNAAFRRLAALLLSDPHVDDEDDCKVR